MARGDPRASKFKGITKLQQGAGVGGRRFRQCIDAVRLPGVWGRDGCAGAGESL